MGDWKQSGRALVRPVVAGLDRLGFTPLAVTLLGLVISAGAAAAAAMGRLRLAAGLLIIGAGFDTLDGELARRQGRVSRQGAFLDSNLDRVGESLLFAGLLWHAVAGLPAPRPLTALLILLATAGSLMTSYARARAEGLGTSCREGLFQRPERMILVIVGLLLGWAALEWILGLLAALTLATTAQRIVHVYRKLAAAPGAAEGRPPGKDGQP